MIVLSVCLFFPHLGKSKDAIVAVLLGEKTARVLEALFGTQQGILTDATI
jgi:hypothetical protein